MDSKRCLLLILLFLAGGWSVFGQNKSEKDSLFRLVQAERAEQYEQYGMHYRLVKGHARFLHNDTYLLCDSASWNVDTRFIEAYGNVQIIQNNTMLKSEEMYYWIDENKAQFRGQLVELFDKDGNTLRTERLIYNTKDSVAVFEYGGALKDKDGNVIESRKGTYDAKEGLFTFEDRTELYMDSIEIKTQTLRYFSEEEKAYFGKNTNVWRGTGFLRADAGWYDRQQQVVQFSDRVFMFDPSYDAWADEVFYYRQDGAVDLFKNVQVLDTTNKSAYLGDHIQYLPAKDSLSERGWMTGDPAIVYFGENENHVVDTLYARADSFFVFTLPRCDVPEEEVKAAENRLEDILYDALAKKREEEAASREEERIAKLREAGKLPPEWVEQQKQAEADSIAALAAADSLALAGERPMPSPDSLAADIPALSDTTAVPPALSDTTAVPPVPRDTTPVRFIHAWNDVRMFRSDLQAVCDSMVFSELDSIARLYGSPVMWNEIRNQLSADEMQLLMKNGSFERGSLLTDAWIISEQDSLHYNQIKSTEMLGYFRDNKLYRFDALGGVSAIFYMLEDQVVTTINVKESKSLTAALRDGKAQRLLYMETIKSDVYPVGQLEPEKQRLKDFKWRAAERPVIREDVTAREVRTSDRHLYEGLVPPTYRETDKYFDNYMTELFARREAERQARKAEQDSLQRAAAQAVLSEQEAQPDSSSVQPAVRDTVSVAEKMAAAPDTVAVRDTSVALRPENLRIPVEDPVRPRREEAAEKSEAEAIAPASPETVTLPREQLSRAEKRALRRAERQARREARRAARQARRIANKLKRYDTH